MHCSFCTIWIDFQSKSCSFVSFFGPQLKANKFTLHESYIKKNTTTKHTHTQLLQRTLTLPCFNVSALLTGEEALTMYLAKNKLDRKLANATQNVEALHQLASSYFIDRDGTMRKLHEIQISTNAIKVGVPTWLPLLTY